jgi:hypothetical protein
MTIERVTYFKTADGTLHPSEGLAAKHEERLREETLTKAELLRQVFIRWPDTKTEQQC